jgi:tellurite resistance protein TerC
METVVPFSAWVVLAASILVLVAIDLVIHRGDRPDSRRAAIIWSAVLIGAALVFGVVVGAWFGRAAGEQYFAAYLVEKSLSVDNLFVFVLVFTSLGIPASQQHRVLTWGIFGAFVMRGLFIGLGMEILQTWHWTVYAFGGLLVAAAVKVLRSGEHPSTPRVVPWLERHLPWTRQLHGKRFVAKVAGKWLATPLLVALIGIELADAMFALDSLPAAFAVTNDPFVIYSSNLFALLGLRALYVVLGDLLARLRYLHFGLAGVLAFAGAKMIASPWIAIAPLTSVLVIAGIIAAAVIASVIGARREATTAPQVERPKHDRVLVAEDDPALRGLIADVLGRSGYGVIEAANGADALDAVGDALLDPASERAPTIVITDVRMPYITGLQLVAALRPLTIPKIVITAFPDDRTRDLAARLGASAVLAKPFELAALLRAVAAVRRC